MWLLTCQCECTEVQCTVQRVQLCRGPHCGRRHNKRYDSTSLLVIVYRLIYRYCTELLEYAGLVWPSPGAQAALHKVTYIHTGRHLHAVFSLLKSDLVEYAKKCIFGCSSIDFLGHRLSSTGISLLSSRVKAITTFPQPATVRQLQAFLVLFNFYQRFILSAARLFCR